MEISQVLLDKGFDPDYLIDHLRETLRQERDMFDTKKKYLTSKEMRDYEIRLTKMETLMVTLMIERLP